MIKKLTILLILVLLYSCSNEKTTVLKGKYSIGGFHMKPEYSMEKLRSLGVLNFGKTPFEFIDNKVYISPELGERFFGNTEFEYELTNDKLILYKKDKKIEMNYIDDGVFRLNIENKYLDRIDLSKFNR
ncbi:hypothetical protein QVZ41_10265 [Wenyingzhuangia sp. chi5]|uniref:Lipoprotein n=1 Tax=Wenyingzhuangia gilva TaxID=3057677 RepID=A0ABT8VTE0_9FLAO|nr:hypothetical protein [Wenyingzhuangia sp. chi5]MDO3695228.1 hypothetical protein [Wenyingzhuangia sp. chi5]